VLIKKWLTQHPDQERSLFPMKSKTAVTQSQKKIGKTLQYGCTNKH